jgi:hypothetical protein
VPLALAASGVLSYGSVFGLGPGEKEKAAAAGTTTAATLTVAKDGTGRYKTVQAAVNAVPAGNRSRVVISVKPGTYRETVNVPANKPLVTIQGMGTSRKDTFIVYGNATGMRKPDGSGPYGTPGSATVALRSDDSQLRNLTVSNDFDEAANQSFKDHQAVALLTTADKIVLDSVIVTGDQDTLELETAAKDKPGRVHVTKSSIVGNVDFILGRATAVIDRSVIILKKSWNGTSASDITAPSTQAGRKGILINRSTIKGDATASSFHLGRNWHPGGDKAADPHHRPRFQAQRSDQAHALDRHGRLLLEEGPLRRIHEHRPGCRPQEHRPAPPDRHPGRSPGGLRLAGQLDPVSAGRKKSAPRTPGARMPAPCCPPVRCPGTASVSLSTAPVPQPLCRRRAAAGVRRAVPACECVRNEAAGHAAPTRPSPAPDGDRQPATAPREAPSSR